MLWNAAFLDSLCNTVLVCLGAACLAVGIGLAMALLIVCGRVPLRRTIATAMLSLILVPVYVQATAWSAGFGVQGWLRLSQVAAALSPAKAIASVVWIHGTAAAPACFLLCMLGLARSADTNMRQSLLDFGPWRTLCRVVIPKMWPWIMASVIWTIAMSGNDMVVTNLFQVPTITETVYQQVQFNQLRAVSLLGASTFALLLMAISGLGLLLYRNRLGTEDSGRSLSNDFHAFALRGANKWLGFAAAMSVLSVATLLPLANLLIKSGWQAKIDGEVITRSWSWPTMINAVVQSFGVFSGELKWSVTLSLASVALSLLIGTLLVWSCRRKWSNLILAMTMVFFLALPGPLINLCVIMLFDRSEPVWVPFLADRTLLGPIIALQFRCLPIVVAVLWIAKFRFERRHHLELEFDRRLPFFTRSYIWFRAMQGPILVGSCVGFFVAFADLSSYLLVQPPGVTTIAMRMFELLHYGVRNQESGLAITIAFLGMLPTLFFVRRIDLA